MHCVVVYHLGEKTSGKANQTVCNRKQIQDSGKQQPAGAGRAEYAALVGQTLVFIGATCQSIGYGRNGNVLQGHNRPFQGNLQNLIHGFNEV